LIVRVVDFVEPRGPDGPILPGCRLSRAGEKMLVPGGSGTNTPSSPMVPVDPIDSWPVGGVSGRFATRFFMQPR